jgi:hypothetical protein
MTERTNQDSILIPLVLGLVFCAWLLGVPYLLLRAVAAVPWDGQITEAQSAEGDAWVAWAAWTAVLVPVLGAIIALVTRRPRAAIPFGVIFGLSVLAIGYISFVNRNDHPRPAPPPEPTQCMPRSGSPNGCPGG